MAVNIKTPVVVENITLMCLRILQKLIKPPAPTSKKNKVSALLGTPGATGNGRELPCGVLIGGQKGSSCPLAEDLLLGPAQQPLELRPSQPPSLAPQDTPVDSLTTVKPYSSEIHAQAQLWLKRDPKASYEVWKKCLPARGTCAAPLASSRSWKGGGRGGPAFAARVCRACPPAPSRRAAIGLRSTPCPALPCPAPPCPPLWAQGDDGTGCRPQTEIPSPYTPHGRARPRWRVAAGFTSSAKLDRREGPRGPVRQPPSTARGSASPAGGTSLEGGREGPEDRAPRWAGVCLAHRREGCGGVGRRPSRGSGLARTTGSKPQGRRLRPHKLLDSGMGCRRGRLASPSPEVSQPRLGVI